MAASTLFEPIQQHEAHKSLFNITIATRQSADSGLCVYATLNLTERALPTCTYLTLLYCRVVPSWLNPLNRNHLGTLRYRRRSTCSR